MFRPQHGSQSNDRGKRYATIAQNAGVGIWDLDLSTRKLEWSDTARSLFGVGRDQAVTYELFLSLLQPKDRERTEAALKRVAEVGGNFDISFKVGGSSNSGNVERGFQSVLSSLRVRVCAFTRPSEIQRAISSALTGPR